MPMHKHNPLPSIFRRNLLLASSMGIGCALITLIVYFITHDRALLQLGSIAFLFFAVKSVLLWNTAQKQHYEVIEGIFYLAEHPLSQFFHSVRIEQPHRADITLMLNRNQKILHGHTYRLYFKRSAHFDPDPQYLLPSDVIGIEPVDPATVKNLEYL